MDQKKKKITQKKKKAKEWKQSKCASVRDGVKFSTVRHTAEHCAANSRDTINPRLWAWKKAAIYRNAKKLCNGSRD